MKRLKTYLGATTGFAMFAAVIAIAVPQTGHGITAMAAADKTNDVRVINTTAEPVPVSVQGTQTVSLASNQVVVVRDPFQQFVAASSNNQGEFCVPVVIPAGKQLTIESFSTEAQSSTKPDVYILAAANVSNGGNNIRSVHVQFQSLGGLDWAGDVKTLLHSGSTHDPDNSVFSYFVCASNSTQGNLTEFRGLVSGWLQ